MKQLEKDFAYKEWCTVAQKFARVLSKDSFQNCKYTELVRQRLLHNTAVEQIVLETIQFGRDFFGIDFEFASW